MGLGYALIAANIVECGAFLLIPLAGGTLTVKIACLVSAFFLNGLGLACANVYYPTLRQAIAPDELLGRVTASYSWLTLGVVPIGAVLAGLLQNVIGMRATLLCGAIGVVLSLLWLCGPKIRKLKVLPS